MWGLGKGLKTSMLCIIISKRDQHGINMWLSMLYMVMHWVPVHDTTTACSDCIICHAHPALDPAAPISALAKNRRYLLSGACDACISLWDMDTGALIDSQPVRGAQRVSAVTFAGPMMVR